MQIILALLSVLNPQDGNAVFFTEDHSLVLAACLLTRAGRVCELAHSLLDERLISFTKYLLH